MARYRFVLVLALALLAAPAPARAGSYDVVMCGAPGAGGVNNSWTPATGTFGPDPAPYYVFDTTCAGGLAVTSTPQNGLRAPWLTFGYWHFAAPAGTMITRATVWRYGEARDDRQENGSDDDHWQLLAQDDKGNQIGGVFGPDECHHGAGVAVCTIGAQGGVGAASKSPDYALATTALSWGVVCGGPITDGCQTAYGIPLDSLFLYGARVTLQDNSRPALSAGGPLLAGGWRRPVDAVTFDASDNSGIRSASLTLDGQLVARTTFACNATVPVPCSNQRGRQLSPAGHVPSVGNHALRLSVVDAAGNQTDLDRTVAIDSAAPQPVSFRARGRTLRLRLADAGSGVTQGQLLARQGRTQPFGPLPTTLQGSTLVAQLPRGRASRAGWRVVVSDAVGNTLQGQLTRIRVSAGHHAVRRSHVHVRFGHGALLHGRLVTVDGVPVGGAPVTVIRALRATGAPAQALRTVTTDGTGLFAFFAAPGPSRQIRFAAGPAGDALATTREVSLRTAASTTISARPRRLGGAGTVVFSGRLRTLGQHVPPSGKLVDLQAFDRGRWRTFGTTRARGRGAHWRLRYAFSGAPGRYPVRARIRREAAWPFDLGYSRAVTVRVF